MIPISILLPSTSPLTFPMTLLIHSLLVNCYIQNTHTYNACVLTLLSPFSIALMYMYSMLNSKDSTSHGGIHP